MTGLVASPLFKSLITLVVSGIFPDVPFIGLPIKCEKFQVDYLVVCRSIGKIICDSSLGRPRTLVWINTARTLHGDLSVHVQASGPHSYSELTCVRVCCTAFIRFDKGTEESREGITGLAERDNKVAVGVLRVGVAV